MDFTNTRLQQTDMRFMSIAFPHMIKYDSVVILLSLLLYRIFAGSVSLSIYSSTVLVDFARFFSVLICTESAGLLGQGDQPVTRPLRTQNKRRQIFMPRVGFELMIPVFERAKMVLALDRAVIVIGSFAN
jgi:hypothetical protein